MSLPGFSVRRPVTTLMLVAMVLVLGWVALTRLAIDLLPNFTYPAAAVIATYQGAGPQEIENMITRPLESILGTVTGVKKITSYSMAERSIVVVEFEWGTNMDFATLNMREKIDLVKGYFPDGVESPTVMKFDPAMLPIMNLGVSGQRSLASLKRIVNDIKSRLERLDGVAMVSLSGGLDREIQIELDPHRLKQYGLSAAQIIQALRLENNNLPGGMVNQRTKRLTLRTLGEFSTLDEIGAILISSPGGPVVRLADLGTIREGFAEQQSLCRVNTHPSIGLSIQKQANANTVLVARRIKRELKALQQTLPKDIRITIAVDQSEFIERSIASVRNNAYAGAFLAVLVLFAFLWHWAPTFIIALSIPISIVATFVMMYFGRLTLNLMTLGGLALGVGMMVDNSIVVLENIYRYRQEGHPLLEAAIKGAEEVSLAIQASTFTNLVVFLPVVFVEGIAGQIFREMALTITYALLASLVVALTLAPTLSARLLHRVKLNSTFGGEEAAARSGGRLGRRYYRLLTTALAHRRTVVLVAIGAFLTSFIPWAFVEKQFMPQMDTRRLSVTITMPNGTRLQETDRVAKTVERLVKAQPEVETVFTTVGGGNAFGMSLGAGTETASLSVRLKRGRAARNGRSTEELADYLRQKTHQIAGASIKVIPASSMLGLTGLSTPVEIRLKGDNLSVLAGLADQVVRRIGRIKGIREVESSLARGRPEVRIRLRREAAARYALSTGIVANAIQTAIAGSVATQYKVGGEEIDIRVRYAGAAEGTVPDLNDLLIPTSAGMVPLREVAEIAYATGPNIINRQNQARTVRVTAQVYGRVSGAVLREVEETLKDLRLPEGYHLEFGGEQEQIAESFGQLGLALLLAIFLVYGVMAAQFESLLQPLIVMFTIPMAFIGVAWALFLTGKPLSLYAIIGCIMLVGIVVNNAIVLVDYINTLRRRGIPREEAVRRAAPIRLRPVLMTTLTTILGLVPLALGLGEGGEAEAPMALTIIGGLTMSTLLTLVVIPVLYLAFDDFACWLGRIFPAKIPGAEVETRSGQNLSTEG